MSRVKSFRFGPGSLESVELRMWAVPRRYEGLMKQVKAQAVGSYRLYCGRGWEHQVDIDEAFTFDLERPVDDIHRRLAAAWAGRDDGAAFDATGQLVDWALDDWTDPCGVDSEKL